MCGGCSKPEAARMTSMRATGLSVITWAEVHAVRMTRHLLAFAATRVAPVGTDPAAADPVAVADRVAGLQAQVGGVPALSVLARDRGGAPAWPGRHGNWSKLARV